MVRVPGLAVPMFASAPRSRSQQLKPQVIPLLLVWREPWTTPEAQQFTAELVVLRSSCRSFSGDGGWGGAGGGGRGDTMGDSKQHKKLRIYIYIYVYVYVYMCRMLPKSENKTMNH